MININNELKIFRDENGEVIYVIKKNNRVFFDLEDAIKYCKKEYFNDFYKNNTIAGQNDYGSTFNATSTEVLSWIVKNREFLINFLQGL